MDEKKTDQSVPSWGAFEWTGERVAAARKVAENGGTAAEAAVAVGLQAGHAPRLYKLAKREGFRFRNTGRKSSASRAIIVTLDDVPSRELTNCANARKKARGELAATLLNIVLQQGQTFIDNLLDDAG